MKAFLYMVALSMALAPLAGCETLTETPGENLTRLAHTQDTNFHEIPVDIEHHLLLDRPSWLAREPIPNQ